MLNYQALVEAGELVGQMAIEHSSLGTASATRWTSVLQLIGHIAELLIAGHPDNPRNAVPAAAPAAVAGPPL